MAIGTTAAILGSAVIGAGASAISSGRNSKAINQATQAQTDANAQSVALQRDIYGKNQAALNPFQQRGNAAGNALNALLGLGGTQQTQTQPNAFAQFAGPTGGAGAPYGLGDGYIGPGSFINTGGFNRAAYGDATGDLSGGVLGQYLANLPQFNSGAIPQTGAIPQQATGVPGQTAQDAANNAFDIYRGSTGYQFRVNEGMDALNSGYAGAGLLQSGAALKALDDYRQNMASQEFGNYLGYLSQQQGTGLQAAGAQAGVGVNYANSVSNLNQANANALSNAAVARANNSNAFIGSLGNIGANALGYFGGR